MKVGMEGQRTGPGVQDRGDSERAAEALRVLTELEQGGGRGGEQEVEEADPVAQGDRLELLGDGEDHVEVVGGEHTLDAIGDPLGLAQALALGAVTIAARIVGGPGVSARVAHVQMPAQDGRPAGLDITHHPTIEVAVAKGETEAVAELAQVKGGELGMIDPARIEETINVVNSVFKLKTPVSVNDVYAPGFVSK